MALWFDYIDERENKNRGPKLLDAKFLFKTQINLTSNS